MKTAFMMVALLCSVTGAWLALGAEKPLTNQDIIRLTNAGVAEAAILTMINTSATDFGTTPDQVVELAEAAVGDNVIVAMVNAAKGAGTDLLSTRLYAPGSTFRDTLPSGGASPEMVVVPAGRFWMGCVSGKDCYDHGKPVREVVIAKPFSLSVHEVTFDDYDRFVPAMRTDDRGWGRGRRPVINVSWNDARDYVDWLATETGKDYRLPTEAEWEYAARAGTTRKWHFGNDDAELCAYANHLDLSSDAIAEDLRRTVLYQGRNLRCSDGFGDRTAPVGSFAPNPWGLRDMHGNVFEWVEDCWNDSYTGAPRDGRVWLQGDCQQRVVRGGGWTSIDGNVSASFRMGSNQNLRRHELGFRVARTLEPSRDDELR